MNVARQIVLPLHENRVWRTYMGGRTLDEVAGVTSPRDSHFSEDWIASTVIARNAGREHIEEGISRVRIGDRLVRLNDLLASDPIYYLGEQHVAFAGSELNILVKFLDSATRLHFQVHPSREFAKTRLQVRHGKTEAYHILAARKDTISEPYVYIGFQRPPSRKDLREMIEGQKIEEIEQCFDRISVTAGDTLIIPGGRPHALGPGVFMVEIQEPSDAVVRFEFERDGYRLPEPARFMGRDVEFALDMFDWSPLSDSQVETQVRCRPRPLRNIPGCGIEEELIGADRTDCFRVTRTHLNAPLPRDVGRMSVAIVTEGSIEARSPLDSIVLKQYDRLLIPAGMACFEWNPLSEEATIIECWPLSESR